MYVNITASQFISILLSVVLAIAAIANIINAKSVNLSVKLSAQSNRDKDVLDLVINNAGPAPAKGVLWVLGGGNSRGEPINFETIRYDFIPVIGPKEEVVVQGRILKKDGAVREGFPVSHFIDAGKFETLFVCIKVLHGTWSPQKVERKNLRYTIFSFSTFGKLTGLNKKRIRIGSARKNTYDLTINEDSPVY